MKNSIVRVQEVLIEILNSIYSIDGDRMEIMGNTAMSLGSGMGVWTVKAGRFPRAWFKSGPSAKRYSVPRGTFIEFPRDDLFFCYPHLKEIITSWASHLRENQRVCHSGRDASLTKPLDVWHHIFLAADEQDRIYNTRERCKRPNHSRNRDVNYKKKLREHYLRAEKTREAHGRRLIVADNPYRRKLCLSLRCDQEAADARLERGLDNATLLHSLRKDLYFDEYSETLALRLMIVREEDSTRGTSDLRSLFCGNTYLRIQNLLLKRILLARKLLKWMNRLPTVAVQFSSQPHFQNYHWCAMQLYIHAPRSCEHLSDFPKITIALTDRMSEMARRTSQPSPYLLLRRLRATAGARLPQLMPLLGLPAKRQYVRLIQNLPDSKKCSVELHGMISSIISILRCTPAAIEHLSYKPESLDPECLHFIGRMADGHGSYHSPFTLPSLQLFRSFVIMPPFERDVMTRLLNDTVSMIRSLPSELQSPAAHFGRLSRIRSGKKLRAFHDEILRLSGLYDTWGIPYDMDPVPCPFRDIPDHWKPLCTIEEIHDEAEQMHHCLYHTRTADIAAGFTFAFSITTASGKRATLAVCRDSEHTPWQLDEVAGKYNAELDPADRKQAMEELSRILKGSRETAPSMP